MDLQDSYLQLCGDAVELEQADEACSKDLQATSSSP